MSKTFTMCGYRCDLCKAYAANIQKNDERDILSQVWKKYYNLDIKAADIYCDGCRCNDKNAKRIDQNCPVRACVMTKAVDHCGECDEFPCPTFNERKGLSLEEAKVISDFDKKEYDDYLLAYDNLTRLMDYRKDK